MSSFTPRAPKTQSEICAAARQCTTAESALELIHTALDYHSIQVHQRTPELVALIDVYARLLHAQHKTQTQTVEHLMTLISDKQGVIQAQDATIRDQQKLIERSAILEFEEKTTGKSVFEVPVSDAEVDALLGPAPAADYALDISIN